MADEYPKQDGSQPGVLGDGTEEQNLGQPRKSRGPHH